MTALLILAATVAALTAAGGLHIARVLRRDRGAIWHPEDPLPDVRADAPIRTWKASAAGRAPKAATARTRPAVSAPTR